MNRRTVVLAFLLALSPLGAGVAAESEYNLGIDFEKITPPMPAATDEAGKVQVAEFFWYGCPHCYRFEPFLQAWLENKPEYVEFVRIPAVFSNPRWEIHARAFYTAEVLGLQEQLHAPLFNAIQKERQRLATPDELKAFFAAHGVPEEEFDNAFNSFAVATKLAKAKDLIKRSGINGVPAIVVDGRYRITAEMATSYKRLIAIAASVAERVHEGTIEQ